MVWHRHRSETKLQHTLRIKARKYRRRWIRRSFYGLIASGILCGLGVGGYWFYAMPKLSSVFVSANRTNLFANQTNVRYLNSDGHCFYQTNLSSYKPKIATFLKKAGSIGVILLKLVLILFLVKVYLVDRQLLSS